MKPPRQLVVFPWSGGASDRGVVRWMGRPRHNDVWGASGGRDILNRTINARLINSPLRYDNATLNSNSTIQSLE